MNQNEKIKKFVIRGKIFTSERALKFFKDIIFLDKSFIKIL
jgi:hypothetical protein